MKLFASILLASVAVATAAAAAPFCTVTSFGTACAYYDMESCMQAATPLRGTCVVAPNQTIFGNTLSIPGSPFCVVSAMATQCAYNDVPSCQQAAAMSRGTCIVNPKR